MVKPGGQNQPLSQSNCPVLYLLNEIPAFGIRFLPEGRGHSPIGEVTRAMKKSDSLVGAEEDNGTDFIIRVQRKPIFRLALGEIWNSDVHVHCNSLKVIYLDFLKDFPKNSHLPVIQVKEKPLTQLQNSLTPKLSDTALFADLLLY